MKTIAATIALAPLLLGACTETPLETADHAVLAAAATMPPPPACTKTWDNPAGGDWMDPANWLPAGLPVWGDVVCLTTPGTYDVVMDSTLSMSALVLGGSNAFVTLTFTFELYDRIGIGDEVIVQSGSELVLVGEGFDVTIGGALTNHGTIRVVEGCGCTFGGVLNLHNSFALPTHRNYGLIDLSDATDIRLDPGIDFENYGRIAVNSAYPSSVTFDPETLSVGSTFGMYGGSISGSQVLEIREWQGTRTAEREFTWSGGTLGTLTGDSTKAVLSVSDMDITLSNHALSGRLDIVSDHFSAPLRITGDVGPDVHLRITTDWDDEIEFSALSGSSVVNAGTIEFVAESIITNDLTVSFPALINSGRLSFRDADQVALELDSLVNTGTIAGNSELRLSTFGSNLRNENTIALIRAALHVPTAVTFDATAGSVMTGVLQLEGGILTGEGTLDHIIVRDGAIWPGSPIGTLTASNLFLGPKAAVSFDVAGVNPGEHDLIAVSGGVHYGGSIGITTIAPFVGGVCGQVVPLITDEDSAASGGFSKLSGMAQSPVHEWRLDSQPTVLQLAGFNPVATVFAAPDTVTATEGGARGFYAVCLGRPAPTSDVVVSGQPAGTQIEVLPGTLTFTPSNWTAPQFFDILAKNDSDVEGVHGDAVNHTITTADPFYASAFLRAVDVGIIDNDVATQAAAAAFGRSRPGTGATARHWPAPR